MIRDVNYRATLRFPDSSICSVDSQCLVDSFEDLRKSFIFGCSDVFYPGQKLRGAIKHLKDANWTYQSEELKRAKDRKIVTVVVTDVQPISAFVHWQYHAPNQSKDEDWENALKNVASKSPPADLVKEEDLSRIKCLNLFESCTVQLGDISYCNVTPKVTLEKSIWKKQMLTSATSTNETSVSTSNTKSFSDLPTVNNKGVSNEVEKAICAGNVIKNITDSSESPETALDKENSVIPVVSI